MQAPALQLPLDQELTLLSQLLGRPLLYTEQMKQAYWDLADLAVLGMVVWVWFQIP